MLSILFGVLLSAFAAWMLVVGIMLVFSKESIARKRVQKVFNGQSLFKASIKGTLQRKFSDKRRLTVGLGLRATRDADGKILIEPQGRLSKEASIETLS